MRARPNPATKEQPDMTQNIITWPYVLRKGHSDNPAGGACAMDAVNWLAHGKHGDRPECACPVIGAYVIAGNDGMPDDVRQRLLAYLPSIAGSRSAEHEAARLRVLVLGAVRVFAPMALDKAGLSEHASRLRAMPADASYQDMRAAAAEAAAEAATRAARAAAAEAAAEAAAAAARAAAWAARAAAAAWAARAAAAEAEAEAAATRAARAARAAAWDSYFTVLDAALAAGPQGDPWSADVVDAGVSLYRARGGLVTA
jgi:hypothetical protein